LQNLDVESGITILDHLIENLSQIEAIDDIILGISEGIINADFIDFAEKRGIDYIIGDEGDVLSRLISCGKKADATDILRITSESPFPYLVPLNQSWENHVSGNFDATFLDGVIDGCGFEIISMDALEKSHKGGGDNHRSEFCTLFIRENKEDFLISFVTPPNDLIRMDLRLTIDNPEDLVLGRAIYQQFSHQAPDIDLHEVVEFLDKNPKLKELVAPFCELGYSTMYL
jgi:spore coat polysaccharide biosynthesis protein SpsF